MGSLALFAYFVIPIFSISEFQRMSMGRNIEQVKKAFLIAGVFLILLKIIIAWIPFLIYTMKPELEPGSLLPYIVANYSYPGLKGLIMVAIIAFAMSSADSRINAVTVLFTNDICKLIKPDIKNEIIIARTFAIVLGMGALALSLYETDLFQVIIFTGSFYFPVVAPTLFLTIFGFRSSSTSVLVAMVVGFMIPLVWKLLPVKNHDVVHDIVGLLISMLCSALALIGTHYMLGQKGGWVGIKDKQSLEEDRSAGTRRIFELKQAIKNFTVDGFLRRIAPNNDLVYLTLGIYFIFYTITTMYLTQHNLLGQHGKMMLTIYQTMMISGTIMAMYQVWPLSVKTSTKEAIIRTWYPVAIYYMLTFFSAFFVMLSDFNHVQSALFTLNLILVSILLGWRLALAMIVTGAYLGVKFYYHYFPHLQVSSSFLAPEFTLVYVVAIVATAMIVFIKPKEDYIAATEREVTTLG
jgi:hypothetical protein